MDFKTSVIDGVLFCKLKHIQDERGAFREIFRTEWFEELFKEELQMNCTKSVAGSLRGLHYHIMQTDIWIPIAGRLTAGFADTRRNSRTYGESFTLLLDSKDTGCVIIPPGVAHGYYAEVESMLMYVVNKYYDGSDEYGIAWNDPVLNLNWNADNPILSARDEASKPFDW